MNNITESEEYMQKEEQKVSRANDRAMIDNIADTIDLVELVKVLWNKALWIIAVAIVCGGAMGVYNKVFVKPTYTSEARIYIANTDSIVNLQDIQISAALTQDYATIMTSRSVLKKVIADQKLDMTYQTLGKMISITNPHDTHILSVKVTSASPDNSIRIANSLLKYGIDSIFKTIGNDAPSVIDYAEADAITVNKPSLIKQVMLGGIMGAMLVCGIVVLFFLLDNTVHDEDDVKQLGYPVLAEVPEYSDDVDNKHMKGRKAYGRQ